MLMNQMTPDMIIKLHNNLAGMLTKLLDNLNFLTMVVDSMVEANGEEYINNVNKFLNKKIYMNLLSSREFAENRELMPNEPLDGRSKQLESIQKQIDEVRNDMIDKFGIGFVKECEDKFGKEGGDPGWTKGIIKIK